MLHGTPLQQSPFVVQTWPYSEQTGPPSGGGGVASSGGGGVASSGGGGVASSGGGGVASSGGGGVASSGGGGVASSGGGVAPSGIPASPCGGRPHVPRVEPGGAVQGKPGQQSAAVVQTPPLPTHMPPHTTGGTPPSGVNDGFGTQGIPQQSALVAHACPCFELASVHLSPIIVQRGIPRMSCWQTKGFWLTLPEQQLFSALHDVVASLQIAPAGRHALPLSQRPTGSLGFDLLHEPVPVEPCTPPNPQQSASLRQISPVGRHPLGGWQTKSPVR